MSQVCCQLLDGTCHKFAAIGGTPVSSSVPIGGTPGHKVVAHPHCHRTSDPAHWWNPLPPLIMRLTNWWNPPGSLSIDQLVEPPGSLLIDQLVEPPGSLSIDQLVEPPYLVNWWNPPPYD